VPEIADTWSEIDQPKAITTGAGPFEMFDVLVSRDDDKMRAAGAPIAVNVEKLLAYATSRRGECDLVQG
jgi:hypothetical protein